MSGRAVRGFAPVLREVERGLALPIPDRVRILRELEYDLEELRDRLVAGGLSPEVARRQALQALVPDDATLRELDRLHAPWYRRVTRRLTPDRLRIAERTALAIATASVVVVQTVTLLRVDLLQDPSPFLWPVLALGALLFATVATKAFNLWIKGDHRTPAEGLSMILALAGATVLTGVGGMIFDFYRLAGALEQSPELANVIAGAWLLRDLALMSIAVLLALGGGLAWFVLSQWLSLVDGARSDVLGLNANHPTKGGT